MRHKQFGVRNKSVINKPKHFPIYENSIPFKNLPPTNHEIFPAIKNINKQE